VLKFHQQLLVDEIKPCSGRILDRVPNSEQICAKCEGRLGWRRTVDWATALLKDSGLAAMLRDRKQNTLLGVVPSLLASTEVAALVFLGSREWATSETSMAA
jgi:hypothetical protein